MTDEEIFNEWKSEQYKDQSTEEKMEFVEHLHTFPQYFKKTFLAGLEAGKDMAETDLATIAYMQGADRYKTKWHDLRKNPSDIPNDTRSVWTNVGPSYYDHTDHCWRDEFGRTPGVTAWCEPEFEG